MSQISVSACFTHLSFQTRSSMIPQGIPIHFGVQTQEGNCPWIQDGRDPTSTTNWNTRCISCGRTPQGAPCVGHWLHCWNFQRFLNVGLEKGLKSHAEELQEYVLVFPSFIGKEAV